MSFEANMPCGTMREKNQIPLPLSILQFPLPHPLFPLTFLPLRQPAARIGHNPQQGVRPEEVCEENLNISLEKEKKYVGNEVMCHSTYSCWSLPPPPAPLGCRLRRRRRRRGRSGGGRGCPSFEKANVQIQINYLNKCGKYTVRSTGRCPPRRRTFGLRRRSSRDGPKGGPSCLRWRGRGDGTPVFPHSY